MTTININNEYSAAKAVSKNNIIVFYIVNKNIKIVSGIYENFNSFISSLKGQFSKQDISIARNIKSA